MVADTSTATAPRQFFHNTTSATITHHQIKCKINQLLFPKPLISLFISFQWLPFPHSLQPYLHSLLTPYPIQTPTTTALSLPHLSSAPGSPSYAPPHRLIPSPTPIAVQPQPPCRLASPPRKLLSSSTHVMGLSNFLLGHLGLLKVSIFFFSSVFLQETPFGYARENPKVSSLLLSFFSDFIGLLCECVF